MRYALGIGMMLVLAGLTWLGLQVSAPSVEADESTQPHFTFSTEADQRVLTVRTWGGLANREHEYILWGDGRLELVDRERPGGSVYGEQETLLEFVEMNDLLQIAIDGNFMEWNDAEVSKKVRRAISGEATMGKGGRLFAPNDASWTEITLHLEQYTSPTGEQRSPASVTFSYSWSPGMFKKMFKPGLEVAEVDALLTLRETLHARFPERSSP